jgi:hypothetical protein
MSYGNGEYLLTNTSNYGGALQKKKAILKHKKDKIQ